MFSAGKLAAAVALLLLALAATAVHGCQVSPPPGLRWAWVGGVTDTSAVLVAELHDPDQYRHLRLTLTTPDGTTRNLRPDPPAGTRGQIARFQLTDLTPATLYQWRLGFVAPPPATTPNPAPRAGRFHTFPAPGTPTAFTFALGACMRTGTESPVFAHIARYRPAFFLHMGDLHYEDIADNDPARFEAAVATQLSGPALRPLLETTPIAYVWDDHDFGPNDSDSTSPSKAASAAAYRTLVPHYDLHDDTAVYQAFTVGRVRFVLADLRSQRLRPAQRPSPGSDETPTAVGTMLSERQLEWLKSELLAASRSHAVVFFVSTVPWIDSGSSRDSWNGYRTQRRHLAEFFRDHGITNLAILSGDAHMLALDDGTHSSFTLPPSPPGPVVFHAGALDQRESVKGGPYTYGPHPGPHQFGLVTVLDDGRDVQVVFAGMKADRADANPAELFRFTWTPTPPQGPPARPD
ncbi:MAG: alkaline phosphatase D family protein [Tepidisphaerales bacterium]